MITIRQIYTHSRLRNFTYLLTDQQKKTICIDPFDAATITPFLEKENLDLTTIINTHEHWDHIGGNEELVKLTGAEVWAHNNARDKIPKMSRALKANEEITLSEGHYIKVLDTPGHTFAHLCFLLYEKSQPYALFSGDTLFNAGVGNCHNGGDAETLFHTVKEQLLPLDGDIKLFPGHDYMQNNLDFSQDREPQNPFIEALRAKYHEARKIDQYYVTTLAEEKAVNTFFRLDNAEIITELKKLEKNSESDKAVFLSLRELRNHW